MKKLLFFSLALALFMSACNSNSSETKTETTTDTVSTMPVDTMATTTPSTSALTDPQIASIAVAANQIDVDNGKIALKKSSNADVKKFAQTMINDHTAIIKQATDLATKLNVTPETNPTTQSLLDNAKMVADSLNNKSGAEFDKYYAQSEVNFHQQVIDAVKNTLIPNTQNAELKSLLQSVVPNLEHHLEMAKELSSKLNK